jgi:hypothetical protein
MLFVPSLKRVISAVVISGLLFAQAAFATRPCDHSMSAAHAIATSQEHDCCQQTVQEVSLCVANCTDHSTLPGPEPLKIFAVYVAVALPLPVFDAKGPIVHRARPDPVSDPPSIVRFCRFLI